VRLLLDEHLSPAIAESLRRSGHDAVAVAERDDLRGRRDSAILAAATSEGRSVVTADVADFVVIGARRLPSKQPHKGVILVARRAFPRSSSIGPIVRALDALLTAHPGDDDLVGDMIWLRRIPDESA
jgi:predicted nuclease of predicted toxin-antitoxin system